jgi:hypothetical protein
MVPENPRSPPRNITFQINPRKSVETHEGNPSILIVWNKKPILILNTKAISHNAPPTPQFIETIELLLCY